MEPSAFEKEYMSCFNAQQRKAVRQVDGSVLLLAVPGSGKTTVLVTRLGYMALCCENQAGRDPHRYLYGRGNRGYAGKVRRAFRRRSGKTI